MLCRGRGLNRITLCSRGKLYLQQYRHIEDDYNNNFWPLNGDTVEPRVDGQHSNYKYYRSEW